MKKLISLLLACCLLASLLSALSLGISAAEGKIPVTLYQCGFETEEEFNEWVMFDQDGMANGWIRTSGSAIAPEGRYFLCSYSYIPENDPALTPIVGDNSGYQTTDNWAISPEMTLPDFDEIYLDFDLFARNPGGPYENFRVLLCDLDAGLVHNICEDTLEDGDDYYNPLRISLDLSSFGGKRVQFAIVHYGDKDDENILYRYGLCLDNVQVWYYDNSTEVNAVGVHVSEPETGKSILNEAEVPTYYEGYYVASVSWDPADSVYQPGTAYSVTVTLEAESGYRFASTVYPYINERMATILSASYDQLKIAYTFDPTEGIPEDLSIGYSLTEASLYTGEELTLQALCHIPAEATDVVYQWYVADAPNAPGSPIEGATSDTYSLRASEVGTKYYHCRVSCEMNGYTLTTPTENFATVKVIVMEVLPSFLNVEYSPAEATLAVGESVLLQASCNNLPANAENVSYQWYVASAPNHWGEMIYGANTDTYEFVSGVVETLYFHCLITCTVDGYPLGTCTEEFDTVCVDVTAGGPPSMFFDDVHTSDWFYGDVEFVYYNYLMNGTGENRFSPNEPTTRGMIVTILYRLEGSPAVNGTCPFDDVPAGYYYEDPITWAAENNIVNGMGNGKFAPEDQITREQLSAIFYRYAQSKGISVENDSAPLDSFADCAAVSDWAADAISWAVAVGLVNGSNEADGLYLMPQGNALRCQVAAIIHRYCTTFPV